MYRREVVSAFAAKGKIRPFKAMMNSDEYIDLFSRVGMNKIVNEKMHEEIKIFACHIYSKKSKSCLNELRYQIYCQRDGKIPCEFFSPCEDVLSLRTNRTNYQARAWRSSLDPYFTPASPVSHG